MSKVFYVFNAYILTYIHINAALGTIAEQKYIFYATESILKIWSCCFFVTNYTKIDLASVNSYKRYCIVELCINRYIQALKL